MVFVQNKLCMSFNKPIIGCGNILNFIQIDTQAGGKMDTEAFRFLTQLWPWMKVKVIQTDIKW